MIAADYARKSSADADRNAEGRSRSPCRWGNC
jgi:hypothetical protein